MLGNFIKGLSAITAGFSLITVSGLRRYVAIPLLVNILVFIVMGWLASGWFDGYINSLSWLQSNPDAWYSAIVESFKTILWVVFAIAALIVFTYTFSMVANIIAAPFNSLLAERCETYLKQGCVPTPVEHWSSIVKRIPKTIAAEVGKIFYLLRWLIVVMLVYIIPGVNILAPAVSLAFGAWMLSLEYIDYPLGNHGFSFKQIRLAMRDKRSTAIGFGTAVTVLTAIPIVNLFIMPAAVCAATKLSVDGYPKIQ